MGFGSTRAECRQLISHNAILVNGKKVNIPSYSVKSNDTISIRERSKKQLRIQSSLDLAGQRADVDWVNVDKNQLSGVFTRCPDRDELPKEINENLIVELYSK